MSRTIYPTSLFYCLKMLYAKSSLIKQLIRRDVAGRYRGSLFGMLWSFFNPLLMLAIYSFVFTVIFQVRWGQGTGAKGQYAVVLFAGLALHAFFVECLNRSPVAITGNPNFVKKVVFPLEILVPTVVGSALFHFAISIGVLLMAYIIVFHTLQWTLVFLPLVLLPFILLSIGLSWFLASLGVYFRDVSQIIGVLATVLLFMSPILFPVTSLPPLAQTFIYLNPLSFIVEEMRQVIIWGQSPSWWGLAIYMTVSLIIFWGGFFWFQKTRRGFADVI